MAILTYPHKQKNLPSLMLLLFILAMMLSPLSQAIMMRHDVAIDEYLLDTVQYDSAIHGENCSATLITSRWVLTAAHCFDLTLGQGVAAFGQLTIAGKQFDIKRTYQHPEYGSRGEYSAVYDIALVELQEPSFDVIPTPPYEGSNEEGEIMKLVGFGYIGNAVAGITDECFPCDMRGADNIVTEANEYHLRFRFDPFDSANNLPLEGVGGPGDSGGPAFIETESGRFVAGVSSYGDWRYGDFDQYTRVSKQLSWMLEIMGSDYPGNYSGPLYSEQPHNNEPQQNAKSGGSLNSILLLMSFSLLLGRRLKRKK